MEYPSAQAYETTVSSAEIVARGISRVKPQAAMHSDMAAGQTCVIMYNKQLPKIWMIWRKTITNPLKVDLIAVTAFANDKESFSCPIR